MSSIEEWAEQADKTSSATCNIEDYKDGECESCSG